jgi:GR25 family glycosyltransferase involved in LPS biosynthesis
MNDNNNNLFTNDYSVIFEDDVEFKKDLHFQIQQIIHNLSIQNVDFDVIFLGNLNNNKGKHIVGNVFYLNPEQECWGTHALLFKNKNIKKVYDSVLNFNWPIDIQYKVSACNNEITAIVTYPSICIQKDMNSTIRNNKTSINKVIHNVTNVLVQKKQEMLKKRETQMKRIIQMKKLMQMKKAKRMKQLFITNSGFI